MRTTRIKATWPRLAVAVALTLGLGGCSAPLMYQWGNYDKLLYQSYKSPDTALEVRQALETHILKLESANQRVPPGLYAELGTMYFQSGDNPKAIGYYVKERTTWPESVTLMDALIKNSERARPPAGTSPAPKPAPIAPANPETKS